MSDLDIDSCTLAASPLETSYCGYQQNWGIDAFLLGVYCPLSNSGSLDS